VPSLCLFFEEMKARGSEIVNQIQEEHESDFIVCLLQFRPPSQDSATLVQILKVMSIKTSLPAHQNSP
jgi:hypothetical protein